MLIIKIQNDGTGDVEVGNYRYQILVNNTVIENGTIEKHNRKRGWRNLVEMLLDASRTREAIDVGVMFDPDTDEWWFVDKSEDK